MAAVLLLLQLLLGCQACSPPQKPKNVLLVSVDTLRADFLGAYGNTWVKTPNLDRLASEGFVFEEHISAAPTTLASHTSLFTGTWPHTHGAPRNGFKVHDENVMLPEVLSEAGFQTAAFIGGYPLVGRYGFDQGFEVFEVDFDARTPGLSVYGAQQNAEGLTDAVLAWLSARKDPRPLFLFVHYFDVHAPYMAPEPYYGMYRTDDLPITGTIEDTFRVKSSMRKGLPRATAMSDALAALYAGEVTYVDHHLGRLFDGMRESGLLDETLVAVTADHGETMGEHPVAEVWDHGYAVFDTTQRTPLVVRRPHAWGAGTRVDGMMSNIDVMPTLLDLLEIPIPDRVEGSSFRGALDRTPFEPRAYAFAEATKPSTHEYEVGTAWRNEKKARMVRTEAYKWMVHPKKGRSWLYDLGADPGETEDVSASAPEAIQGDLDDHLDAWVRARAPLESTEEVDEGGRQLLEALGYVDVEAPEEGDVGRAPEPHGEPEPPEEAEP